MASPLIKEVLSIRSRYVRAVNIERDLEDPEALEGYLLTDSVRSALERLCGGLQASSSQRAWRITGAYGSGKSAFGLFLTSLFIYPIGRRSVAGRLLEEEAPDLLAKAKKLPRYDVIVVAGTNEDASIALARALSRLLSTRRVGATQKQLLARLAEFVATREAGRGSAHGVIELLQEVRAFLASGTNASEGLLLVIDEMGRWLEYAADSDTDLDASFFQSLAEVCGGKVQGIPLSVVGILHQRFEDYAAGRRDRRSGQEWAKVAERFEDVTFSQSFESTARLVARGMEVNASAYKRAGIPERASELYAKAVKQGVVATAVERLGKLGVASLYPFHPMALASAMAMFRRFGQNERSTFSFLLSSEPFALQDFIGRHHAGAETWLRVHNLCDWLIAQGSLRTYEDERLKRWALLQDVLRAAPVYDELEVKCLKTVGFLNLLEPQPGLAATRENVTFSLVDEASEKRVSAALSKLIEKSLIYVRPATQELCLWPQSSVDVASELAKIREKAPALTRLGNLIELLSATRPIIAHRHYLETGTLRIAQVTLVEGIEDVSKKLEQGSSSDGTILIVPSYPDQDAKAIGRRLQKISEQAPEGTLLALRRITESDLEVADELLAWTQLEKDCAELRVDTYARNEVRQAIHRLSGALIHRLADLRAPGHGERNATWWHQGEVLDVTDGRALSRHISNLFSSLYAKAPVVRNELINRSTISSAAAAARQRLLERIFTHAEVEDLGIEMTPPEKAIYLSVLKDSGLHAPQQNGWGFQPPEKESHWVPAWNSLQALLEEKGLISVQRVLKHFAAKPFGMRESITLLMVAVFLRVHRSHLILRERGTYLTQIEESHLARMAKRPDSFELHMINAKSIMPAALEVYRDVLSKHLGIAALDATVAEVTRHLYQWYISLPEHTINTAKLRQEHRAVLALLGKAGDPVELLTVTLPTALGISDQPNRSKMAAKIDLELLRAGLVDLLQAGSSRLDNLRADMLQVVAEEVGVRDPSAVRPHIVALAEKAQGDLVDYALKSFIQRSCDGGRNTTQWLDSLANLLGSRTIETWHDDTLLVFRAELRRVYTLLTRVVALAKLTRKNNGIDHAMVAVHVVDQKGQERFVAVPADADGALQPDRMDELRAVLKGFRVPAYALAQLLLEHTAALPNSITKDAA